MKVALGLVLALLCAAGPGAGTRGDMLVLADGRVVQGRELRNVVGGVEVTFPSGVVRVPEALIHLVLIDGGPELEPRNEEERKKMAKGLVPFEGRWISRKRREGLLAKRVAEHEAEVAENRDHREWKDRRRGTSKNFSFEYTVPQHVFEDYRDRLEAYYKVFAKDWKIRSPREGKLEVCFYSNQKEYYRTSGSSRGAIAYFKFANGYELNSYYDRLDPTYTEQVLFHEANHYLQQLINEDFSYPHWPGEALAEYYGGAHWSHEKQELEIGLVQEGRLAEIQDDIARGEWMALRRLLKESSQRNYEDYTWGWSLVYFLMNDARHAPRFKKFVKGLATGRTVKRSPYAYGLTTVKPDDLIEAFDRYLGLKDAKAVSALERDWHEYIRETLLSQISTRGLERGAFKALSTGRKLRAKRMFEEAIEAGSTNPILYHKYAMLLLGDDREQAIANLRKAAELAPLTGSYWDELGRALARTDKAESARLKKLAREIDPELE